MDYRSIDPTSGELVERFETTTPGAIENALKAAVNAFAAWRNVGLEDRAARLNDVADRLDAEAAELGLLMATEMGKPREEGEAEARKCAWVCRYYAENASDFLADSPRESDGSAAWVRYEPLGPVLAIMPWNFPFWQFLRFGAPALAAGNVLLLKHAPNTPRCARRIVSLMAESGLADGLVQNLFLTHDRVTDLLGDPRLRAATLTGSTGAGRSVAATAGARLKPLVLELGGSDAFIVLEDADLDRAVEVGVQSRCLNNGQSCIAAKRFLIHETVYTAFRDRFVAAMRDRETGDPREFGTRLGPLAREDLRDRLTGQVDAAVRAGGRVLAGGRPVEGPGFFYPATVIEGLPHDVPEAREELFGPVAVLTCVASADEAIAIANASAYGLGASLWTADTDRARDLIPRIEAGSVFVNGLVKSDPRLPFGGVKDSGYGRELSCEGIREFVNAKTVWMN